MTWSSTKAVGIVGCTYRQLDYWCRCGLLGGDVIGLGSGANSIRLFSERDLEVLDALTKSAALGSPQNAVDFPSIVATAVRARPVNAVGEWLIVDAAGGAQRFDHVCLDAASSFDAARVIRLCSFASLAVAAGPDVVPQPTSSGPVASTVDETAPIVAGEQMESLYSARFPSADRGENPASARTPATART
jgi:hypothetical protein